MFDDGLRIIGLETCCATAGRVILGDQRHILEMPNRVESRALRVVTRPGTSGQATRQQQDERRGDSYPSALE